MLYRSTIVQYWYTLNGYECRTMKVLYVKAAVYVFDSETVLFIALIILSHF